MTKMALRRRLRSFSLSRVARSRTKDKVQIPEVVVELPRPEEIPLPEDPPEPYILGLPTELILEITSYLPYDAARHLSCTCQRLWYVLGERSLKDIKEKTTKDEQLAFLESFDHIDPTRFLCRACTCFHKRKPVETLFQVEGKVYIDMYPDSCSMHHSKHSRKRDVEHAYDIARMVMRAHRFESAYGFPLSYLTTGWERSQRDNQQWIKRMSARVIKEGRLLLEIQALPLKQEFNQRERTVQIPIRHDLAVGESIWPSTNRCLCPVMADIVPHEDKPGAKITFRSGITADTQNPYFAPKQPIDMTFPFGPLAGQAPDIRDAICGAMLPAEQDILVMNHWVDLGACGAVMTAEFQKLFLRPQDCIVVPRALRSIREVYRASLIHC